MNIKSFIKSKGIFLLINVILFISISLLLWFVKVAPVFLFFLFIVWFLPLFISYTIDYIERKSFYNTIINEMNSLDQKYLLSEIIEEPNFLEGQILYDILKTTDKAMHEHVNEYKKMQSEYREYIETWVHEIKTPIASGKLILENNKNEVSKGLYEELNNVEELVEQALYYARSNSVSKDYMVKEFDLKKLVSRVIKKNARVFIHKKIKLTLSEIDETVYSDEKWVEFMVNQILVNAINYCKSEEGTISISTSKYEHNLVLHIIDNGIGIDEKDIGRVFEKGFTGKNGRVYRKSTGIGLYLCKQLAEKLHLGIEIKSTKNVGTEVMIIFPKSKVILLES